MTRRESAYINECIRLGMTRKEAENLFGLGKAAYWHRRKRMKNKETK